MTEEHKAKLKAAREAAKAAREAAKAAKLNNPLTDDERNAEIEKLKKENVSDSPVTSTPSPEPAVTPTGTPLPEKSDTVEIKRDHLNQIMKQMENQARDIELLYKASDKNRIAKALNEGGEILIKQVRIWTWEESGKIVVATSLVSNRSEYILGKYYEDQQVAVVFEDGTTVTVPYLEFSRKTLNKIPAEIISTSKSIGKDNKEVVNYRVQFPNGKELEINAAFVN